MALSLYRIDFRLDSLWREWKIIQWSSGSFEPNFLRYQCDTMETVFLEFPSIGIAVTTTEAYFGIWQQTAHIKKNCSYLEQSTDCLNCLILSTFVRCVLCGVEIDVVYVIILMMLLFSCGTDTIYCRHMLRQRSFSILRETHALFSHCSTSTVIVCVCVCVCVLDSSEWYPYALLSVTAILVLAAYSCLCLLYFVTLSNFEK